MAFTSLSPESAFKSPQLQWEGKALPLIESNDGLRVFQTHGRSGVGDDEVGMDARRFRQPFVAGPDSGEILLNDGFRRAAALGLIAQQAADEADVRRGVDEHLDVEQGRQGGRAQQVGAFDHDHLGGADSFALWLAPVVDEGIDRRRYGLAALQRRQVGDQQIVIARRHVVEIMGRGVEAGNRRGVQIVGIFPQQGGHAVGQGGNKGFGQGALARARTASDCDQDGHGRSTSSARVLTQARGGRF
uniref:Transcriptional regulator n=1 Tax=Parastrongyloides trichosuri TaxID=131310 RepID=A0A0N4ZXM2_PARTI